MNLVSETAVAVINFASRLTWLSEPEGTIGLFEHYIVNENGKQIRFSDFKAKVFENINVPVLKSHLLQKNPKFLGYFFWPK